MQRLPRARTARQQHNGFAPKERVCPLQIESECRGYLVVTE
jgi:hypothetical protein